MTSSYQKISGFDRPHVSEMLSESKISSLESRFKSFRICIACEFAVCVWTIAVSGKKKLRLQKYPDTCGRGGRYKTQVTGPRSQVPGPRSQVAGHRSHVTGRRSQVARHRKFNKKVRYLIRLFMFICFFHFRLRHDQAYVCHRPCFPVLF